MDEDSPKKIRRRVPPNLDAENHDPSCKKIENFGGRGEKIGKFEKKIGWQEFVKEEEI